MRLIAGLLLILLGLGWLAVTVPVAKTEPHCADLPVDDGWRRTTDGWQHRDCWTPHHRASSPGLHPAIVGLLELQLSLAALVGLSGRRTAEYRTGNSESGSSSAAVPTGCRRAGDR